MNTTLDPGNSPLERLKEIRSLLSDLERGEDPLSGTIRELLEVIDSYQVGIQMLHKNALKFSCADSETCGHAGCRFADYTYLMLDNYLRGDFPDRRPRWLSAEWKMPRIPDDPLLEYVEMIR